MNFISARVEEKRLEAQAEKDRQTALYEVAVRLRHDIIEFYEMSRNGPVECDFDGGKLTKLYVARGEKQVNITVEDADRFDMMITNRGTGVFEDIEGSLSQVADTLLQMIGH